MFNSPTIEKKTKDQPKQVFRPKPNFAISAENKNVKIETINTYINIYKL